MAGKIRVFEKLPDGRLSEVRDSDARKGQRVSRVHLTIDVVWTPAEIAAAEAEAEAAAEHQRQEKAAAEQRLQRRAEIAERIGVTPDELDELFRA